jgi:hypothetical protein
MVMTTSLTLSSTGRRSLMTTMLELTVTSQSVWARSWGMTSAAATPRGRPISISTFSVV